MTRKSSSVFFTILAVFGALSFAACTKGSKGGAGGQEISIYTSLYKDTLDRLEPGLKAAFPKVKINWVQGSAEEIEAKVSAEIVSGGTKADILLTSDRFWFEDLARKELLQPYAPPAAQALSANLKNPKDLYATVALSGVIIAYNTESVATPPKTFKELGDERWKGKVSVVDPLYSPTSFASLAFLQSRYGWDYFQRLKKNDLLIDSSASSLVRRIQTKDRPVGIALLENLARFRGESRLKVVFPEDGVIFLNNVVAIPRRMEGVADTVAPIVNWFFEQTAQNVFVQADLYSPFPDRAPPEGAPAYTTLKDKAFAWTPAFLGAAVEEQVRLKEKFAELLVKPAP